MCYKFCDLIQKKVIISKTFWSLRALLPKRSTNIGPSMFARSLAVKLPCVQQNACCPSVLSSDINKHEYRLSYRRIWNRRTVVCSFPGVFLCCDLPLMDLACFVGSTIKPTHPPTNPKTQQTGVFWCISDIRSKPRLKIIRSKNKIQPKVGLQNTRSDLR